MMLTPRRLLGTYAHAQSRALVIGADREALCARAPQSSMAADGARQLHNCEEQGGKCPPCPPPALAGPPDSIRKRWGLKVRLLAPSCPPGRTANGSNVRPKPVAPPGSASRFRMPANRNPRPPSLMKSSEPQCGCNLQVVPSKSD